MPFFNGKCECHGTKTEEQKYQAQSIVAVHKNTADKVEWQVTMTDRCYPPHIFNRNTEGFALVLNCCIERRLNRIILRIHAVCTVVHTRCSPVPIENLILTQRHVCVYSTFCF